MSDYEKHYKKLVNYISNKNIPHIIFHGPHCTGKKTMLNNFIDMIYEYDSSAKHKYVLYIDCTSSKGIKMIKDTVMIFAKQQINKSKYDFKSIILYDADFLTHDAQYSLRRCIEEHSNNTRFFMICTDKNKLLNPICSRFTHLYLSKYQSNHIFDDKINKRNLLSNQITLNNIMKNIETCPVDEVIKIVDDLYERGYFAIQVLNFFNKHDKFIRMKFKFEIISKHVINEKYSMLYIIMFFRNNQDIVISNI